MSSSDQEPLLNYKSVLSDYYGSLESRIGYKIFLGSTRHFGYYDADNWWPFPINGALRAMEDNVFESLKISPGSEVLDAGCGAGHVAMHIARKGVHVQGIDLLDIHLRSARRNIKAAGMEKDVSVRQMDYHNLDSFADGSFDAVYTMETFVHAFDPERVLEEFFRVLKPGGSITLREYDHSDVNAAPKFLRESMQQINKDAYMPTWTLLKEGVLPRMLEKKGFRDVVTEDLSKNIRPMLQLFFIFAYVPYLFVRILGLEAWFVNTVAGVQGLRGQNANVWRYIAVTARKPAQQVSENGGVRKRN